MRQNKRNVLGYVGIVLALTVVVGASTVFFQMRPTAAAEAVTVSERATVVESPFTQAVKQVRDSVVGVNNYARTSSRSNGFYYGFGFGYSDPGSDSGETREVLQGSGSGVVIAKGYVLTNYHVVESASSLEVTTGDDTYPATVAGYDENLDVAVLKCEGLNLAPAVLGDSDLLNVGDWAICIGNPLSFTGTTTVGVISALNREITNTTRDVYGRRTEYKNAMIQTDAAINSGNSGGGMFNVAGELVGIPSLKYTGSYYSSATVEGIGMAIPINAAKPLIVDVTSGKIVGDTTAAAGNENVGSAITSGNKPRIGVTVSNMNESNPAVMTGILPMGAYVTDVEAGSPAEKAGLQVGDIVVEVDGNVITTTKQMVSILQAKEAGQTAAVKIYRVEGLDSIQNPEDIPDGEYLDLSIELAILDNVKQ